jgi:hypothetical protein
MVAKAFYSQINKFLEEKYNFCCGKRQEGWNIFAIGFEYLPVNLLKKNIFCEIKFLCFLLNSPL